MFGEHKVPMFNSELGAQITSWLNIHFDKLDQIIENVRHEEQASEHHRTSFVTGMGNAPAMDSTGAARVVLGGQKAGYDWIIERYAMIVYAPNASGQNVSWYLDAFAQQNLVYYDTVVPGGYSNSPFTGATNNIISTNNISPNGLFVPENSELIINFAGMGVGAIAYMNMQGKLLKRAQHHRYATRLNTGAP